MYLSYKNLNMHKFKMCDKNPRLKFQIYFEISSQPEIFETL